MVSTQTLFAENYDEHCVQASAGTFRNCSEDVRFQAHAASSRALEFAAQIRASCGDVRKRACDLRKRATDEPHTGKCDAILVTPISANLIREDSDAATFLDNFSLVMGSKPAISKSQKSPKPQSTVPTLSNSLLTPPTTTRQPSRSPSVETKAIDCLDPFHISCTESYSASVLENADTSDTSAIDWTDLLLPAFVVENKKTDERETKALNQGRMYSVSAVTFLASLGITGYPIYCLITSGSIGGVLVTWHAKAEQVRAQFLSSLPDSELTSYVLQQKIYIMERNIRTFDLSNPIQAFQFATFLLRLREQSEDLRTLFEGKNDEFIKKAQSHELASWTKEAQTNSIQTSLATHPGATETSEAHGGVEV